ncbi:hypothetical protein FB567DRAFT_616840 [Paraphoma chrysanthemicola]|uniref:Uncharacterized protein n=1 Tax=Paraphoma chrysanthemicola TaxID=798071 RepID=A0A8K0RBD9_9PLEO|nr:hypothetical protein FB567DRAFT_616840 [Paraphoma chrysanthemicola]
MAQRTDAESAFSQKNLEFAEVWRMGSRSRRLMLQRILHARQRRQAAAKRADPDRRAVVHAPHCSPAANLRSGESSSPIRQCAVGVAGTQFAEAADGDAWAGRREFAAAAAERTDRQCSRNEAAAQESADGCVEDAGGELELCLGDGCWRSSGDAQHHTSTSRRLHTQSKFTSGLAGRVRSRRHGGRWPAHTAWTEQQSREEQAVSRWGHRHGPQTMLTGLIRRRCGRQGRRMEKHADRDWPSSHLPPYSARYARKRAHDSTPSHLTTEAHARTTAQRHSRSDVLSGCCLAQTVCWSAARAAQRSGGSPCYFGASSHHPRSLSAVDGQSILSGRLFCYCVPLPEAPAGVPIGIRRLNTRSQSLGPEIFEAPGQTFTAPAHDVAGADEHKRGPARSHPSERSEGTPWRNIWLLCAAAQLVVLSGPAGAMICTAAASQRRASLGRAVVGPPTRRRSPAAREMLLRPGAFNAAIAPTPVNSTTAHEASTAREHVQRGDSRARDALLAMSADMTRELNEPHLDNYVRRGARHAHSQLLLNAFHSAQTTRRRASTFIVVSRAPKPMMSPVPRAGRAALTQDSSFRPAETRPGHSAICAAAVVARTTVGAARLLIDHGTPAARPAQQSGCIHARSMRTVTASGPARRQQASHTVHWGIRQISSPLQAPNQLFASTSALSILAMSLHVQ